MMNLIKPLHKHDLILYLSTETSWNLLEEVVMQTYPHEFMGQPKELFSVVLDRYISLVETFPESHDAFIEKHAYHSLKRDIPGFTHDQFNIIINVFYTLFMSYKFAHKYLQDYTRNDIVDAFRQVLQKAKIEDPSTAFRTSIYQHILDVEEIELIGWRP